MSPNKTSIDIGLSALCHHQKNGQTLTFAEIADVCECSTAMIKQIQQTALRKLRRQQHGAPSDYLD